MGQLDSGLLRALGRAEQDSHWEVGHEPEQHWEVGHLQQEQPAKVYLNHYIAKQHQCGPRHLKVVWIASGRLGAGNLK